MFDQIECVYLIGCETNTLVKIGRSIDVQARLAALQAGSPVQLTLLWQTLGGAELEAALHRRFKDRRAHGEWFDFPDGDAVACVVQALPAIAAEMQSLQRERLTQEMQQEQAVRAMVEPRARVTQAEWTERIKQTVADHPGINLKPSAVLSAMGVPEADRSKISTSGVFKRAMSTVRAVSE